MRKHTRNSQVSNAMLFNKEYTAFYIQAAMMQKELNLVRDELDAAGHQTLLGGSVD